MMEYQFITTTAQLHLYCQKASQQPALCIDTEFVRTRTFYPQAGLVQLYDGEQVAIIDPIAIDDLSELWALLTNPNVLKVIHSCSEDIELFNHIAGIAPTPLVDTQIAAAFLGLGTSLGYGALVKHFLDETLDKGEARTNWLQRPLTEKQLSYAVNDVLYLMPCFEAIRAQICDTRWQYALQETQLVVSKRLQQTVAERAYLQVGAAWQLKPKQLAVLQVLCEWRLQQATRKDSALNFVIREESLLAIAKQMPKTIYQLQQLKELKPNEIRIHGKKLLQLVHNIDAFEPETYPEKVKRLTDFPSYKKQYSALRQRLTELAEANDFAPEQFASKRQINQLFYWFWNPAMLNNLDEKPDLLQGWRFELAESLLTEFFPEAAEV